jgi:hypothetical protein
LILGWVKKLLRSRAPVGVVDIFGIVYYLHKYICTIFDKT